MVSLARISQFEYTPTLIRSLYLVWLTSGFSRERFTIALSARRLQAHVSQLRMFSL
jgi:hypothetical protein